MADAKISELTAMNDIATGDLIPIVDVSATATEKITYEDFSNAQVAYVSLITSYTTAITVGGALVRSGYYINKNTDETEAMTFNLPVAVAGMQFCFKNSYSGDGTTVTSVLTINPQNDAYIEIDGTEGGAGKYIASSGAAGDMITLLAVDSTHWSVIGVSGTWSLEA